MPAHTLHTATCSHAVLLRLCLCMELCLKLQGWQEEQLAASSTATSIHQLYTAHQQCRGGPGTASAQTVSAGLIQLGVTVSCVIAAAAALLLRPRTPFAVRMAWLSHLDTFVARETSTGHRTVCTPRVLLFHCCCAAAQVAQNCWTALPEETRKRSVHQDHDMHYEVPYVQQVASKQTNSCCCCSCSCRCAYLIRASSVTSSKDLPFAAAYS